MSDTPDIYNLLLPEHENYAREPVDQFDVKLLEGQLTELPEDVGAGGFYFTKIFPGFYSVVCDFILKKPIIFKRQKTENDIYIIHYDFTVEKNSMNISETEFEIGFKENLGLIVFDNSMNTVFQPLVGERVFIMRLVVTKDLFNSFNGNKINIKPINYKSKGKDMLFFNNHIDSESRVIMHALKNKPLSDPAFEIYLRGASIRLLANFMEMHSSCKSINSLTEKDKEALNTIENYLLNNLTAKFPGIDFLADLADMTVPKFMILFKERFIETPNQFYIKQKMILANNLLKSGKFDSIVQISQQLNYAKSNSFSEHYFRQFGKAPNEDFVKMIF